jgi:hypothetical protein
LTARGGSSTKISVKDRNADVALLRDALIEVLRNELRRQSNEFGMSFIQWYKEDGKPAPGINYEGDIHLGEMADAIIKAIETRKIGP